VAEEDIHFAYESFATPDTSRQMARAMVGRTMRLRRFWTFFAVLWAVLAAYLCAFGFGDDDLSVASRLIGAILWSAALTLIVVVVLAALIYFGNRRTLGKGAFRPGTAMRTGFGRDEFVTANSLSSSRFSYAAVRSVEVYDHFVFIRYVGQPVVRVYPSELFPSEALQRLAEAAKST
jgi:hypothetical protein